MNPHLAVEPAQFVRDIAERMRSAQYGIRGRPASDLTRSEMRSRGRGPGSDLSESSIKCKLVMTKRAEQYERAQAASRRRLPRCASSQWARSRPTVASLFNQRRSSCRSLRSWKRAVSPKLRYTNSPTGIKHRAGQRAERVRLYVSSTAAHQKESFGMIWMMKR